MDPHKATRFVHDLLKTLVSKNGSGMFITVGAAPSMKVDGKIVPKTDQPLSPTHTQMLVRSIMNDRQAAEFEKTKECNFAIGLAELSRFHVNTFSQRGNTGIVAHVIKSEIPDCEQLDLPPVFKDVAMTKRALMIFVGGTRSGKSTSLAAMIGYRNGNSQGHIITIEDLVRICARPQELRGYFARGGRGYGKLPGRFEEYVAPGPECNSDRRDTRPRDHAIRYLVF
jgi:twitching motility protein PilU